MAADPPASSPFMTMAARNRFRKFLSAILALSVLFLLAVHSGGLRRLSVPVREDYSAYALPDGTLPLICAHAQADPGQSEDKPAGAQRECPACVLCKILVLAASPDLPEPRAYAGRISLPLPGDLWLPLGRTGNHRARAPPLNVTV